MPADTFAPPGRPVPVLPLMWGIWILVLSGCASAPPPAQDAPPLRLPEAGASTPTPTPPGRQPGLTAEPMTPEAVASVEAGAVKFLLDYAERLRGLNPVELGTEISALGTPGSQVLGQMQLALALTHTHQPVDTARALGLLQRVLAQEGAAAQPYKALARLLLTRLQEQRKLEDSLERQTQQLREQQRRIEQLNERLEAMRAIERSLNKRPGSPSNGPTRPATPP